MSCAIDGRNKDKHTNGEQNEKITESKLDDISGSFGTKDRLEFKYTSFHDFIYNFSYDSVFQVYSIKFPLVLNSFNKNTYIQKNEWKYLPLFSNTSIGEEGLILYNDTSAFGLPRDTSIYEYTVSLLNSKILKNLNFTRQGNSWFLESINEIPFEMAQDDFIPFLFNFANDSVFQHNSIIFPLKCIFFGEESEDGTSEYIPKEYSVSKKEYQTDTYLKKRFAYNIPLDIIYTERRSKFRQIRVFNQGGLHIRYMFEKQNNKWYLIKYEDTSM